MKIAALVGVFMFGGVVKGGTGVGLPPVLVPLATQCVRVPGAVALVSVSMVVTNVVQPLEGGHTGTGVRKLLPILFPLVVGVIIGTHRLLSIDRRRLRRIAGISFPLLRSCCCPCRGYGSARKPRAVAARLSASAPACRAA